MLSTFVAAKAAVATARGLANAPTAAHGSGPPIRTTGSTAPARVAGRGWGCTPGLGQS